MRWEDRQEGGRALNDLDTVQRCRPLGRYPRHRIWNNRLPMRRPFFVVSGDSGVHKKRYKTATKALQKNSVSQFSGPPAHQIYTKFTPFFAVIAEHKKICEFCEAIKNEILRRFSEESRHFRPHKKEQNLIKPDISDAIKGNLRKPTFSGCRKKHIRAISALI